MPVASKAQSRLLNARFGHEWVKRHHFDQSTKGLPEHKRKRVSKGRTKHPLTRSLVEKGQL